MSERVFTMTREEVVTALQRRGGIPQENIERSVDLAQKYGRAWVLRGNWVRDIELFYKLEPGTTDTWGWAF